MSKARDIANSTETLDVDGGTIKLDGNYPTGTGNVALGNQALDDGSLSGTHNTAIGNDSLTSNTSGGANTSVGSYSLDANTTGNYNTAVGYFSLTENITGSNNTGIGRDALRNTTASNNTAVGYQAGYANTTGTSNVALGYTALDANTTADNNTALGAYALTSNTTGTNNTASGSGVMNSNTTGSENTAMGVSALYYNNGSYNTAIGRQALLNNTTANSNTAVGYQALYDNTTGNVNTAVGQIAGTNITTGNANTALGRASLATATTGGSNTAVGSDALELATGNGNTALGQGSGSQITTGNYNTILGRYNGNQGGLDIRTSSNNIVLSDGDGNPRVWINSSGSFRVNKVSTALTEGGFQALDNDYMAFTNTSAGSGDRLLLLNRQGSDGTLVEFRQENSKEGTITVSGSTTSYNGFAGRHESSGIPTTTAIGTVVSTIDELDTYPSLQGGEAHPKAGQPRADHAKVKVSDTVGDTAVYGVVNEFDADGKVFVVSVGVGSVKVTGACSRGDLLESNGDGTAKVQSDDIVRSKTIGKVTIGNSDTGVKLVSCVFYCG